MKTANKIFLGILLGLCLSPLIARLVVFHGYFLWVLFLLPAGFVVVLAASVVFAIVEKDLKKRILYPIAVVLLYVCAYLSSAFVPRTTAAYIFVSMHESKLNAFVDDIRSNGNIQVLFQPNGPYMVVDNTIYSNGCEDEEIRMSAGVEEAACRRLQDTLDDLDMVYFQVFDKAILFEIEGLLDSRWGIAYSESDDRKFSFEIDRDKKAELRKVKGKWFVFGI